MGSYLRFYIRLEFMKHEICPISGETAAEERVNHLTHLLGFILSVIGFIYLIMRALQKGDGWTLFSMLIYGTSLVMLYGASTLYHGCTRSERKLILKIIDHACIYVLIAGTYTPFALGPLREANGWILFSIEWGMALAGIIYKMFAVHRHKVFSTLMYLGMGWLIVFSWPSLRAHVSTMTIVWLGVGGLFYSLGTIFYLCKQIPWNHAIWHGFVLAGSICQYFSVVNLI